MLADGEMAFGELTSFMLYTFTVAFSIGALSGLYEDFAKSVGASDRVFEFLDRKPALIDGENQLSVVDGTLHFSQVSFAYPSRPNIDVLQGSELRIPKGQQVALVGPSAQNWRRV